MIPEHSIMHRAIIALCLLLALAAPAAMAATTELHVVRYAADGVTILNETTVDYTWLEENLPVQGDGVTHYYHQGPVFEGDKWNPEEDTNVLEKDMGAVKGTDLKDICDLVGGMKEGETVRIKASDGLSRVFPYRNVYEPEPRQGPMVITWYHDEDGYVPDYYSGMRLVFFADTSTNPYGIHAGVWDMHECFDEEYRISTAVSIQQQPGSPYTKRDPHLQRGGAHGRHPRELNPIRGNHLPDGEDTAGDTIHLTGIEWGVTPLCREGGTSSPMRGSWSGQTRSRMSSSTLPPSPEDRCLPSRPTPASSQRRGDRAYTDTVMEEVRWRAHDRICCRVTGTPPDC